MRSSLLIAAITSAMAAFLTGDAIAAAPALPGESCTTDPNEIWADPERWAWNEICEGRVADFNQKLGLSEPLDPSQAEGWDDTRRLSQIFLETILLHEPFRTAIPRQGVRIDGAWFPDKIDLAHARIEQVLWLDNSRIDQGVELSDAQFLSRLTFDGSKVTGESNLAFLEIGGDLQFIGADLGAVSLAGAKVGSRLNMTGAKVSGELNMASLEVGGSLIMSGDADFAGVILTNAKVGDQLDLTGAKVTGALTMIRLQVGSNLFMGDDGSEYADVNLSGAKVNILLAIADAQVSGVLYMQNLEVGTLLMRDDAEFNTVILDGAKVRDDLVIAGTEVLGSLSMFGLEVGGSFFLGESTKLATVSLTGAKVRGQLDLSGATVSGELNMTTLEVGGSLVMGDEAEFADVLLGGAKVGRRIIMTGVKVSGTLNMQSLEVSEFILMRDGAEFAAEVNLSFATIGSNIDLSGASLVSLDLTGTKLGELRLWSAEYGPAQWREAALLVLRNTQVDALQDTWEPDPWPPHLVLDGFAYQRLGGSASAEAEADMAARPSIWFIEWLARDKTYSPQPYRQLAGLLRAAGDDGKADAILYAGLERERDRSQGLAWWGKTLLKSTIGYGLGYRYFWSLFWVAGFVLTGVIVLWRLGAVSTNGLPWVVACSFDLLLPIVKLDDRHGKFVLQMAGWGLYYFYAHQLAGWVLASFLIAGLGGLTQL